MHSPSLLRPVLDDWQNGGFGLYVHWPFCQAKCPYCDFNSHVSAAVDHANWATALAAEVARYGTEIGPRTLNSIFFGGGTPSLMDPTTVARVISSAASVWAFSPDIEITLEANPTSVEAAKFAAFRSAGISRVSVGVQSLCDADLRALGRLHTADEARKAIDTARAVFERVSFDMMYGRQNQSTAQWEVELAEALALGPDHISLYQLTIEPETAFGARADAGKLPGLPNEDQSAELYDQTIHQCASAGLPHYEVSNFAKPGQESRHNLIYWRYGDFVGVGPGAHGRITTDGQRFATESAQRPAEWLKMQKTGNSETVRRAVALPDQAEEMLLSGMRLTEGIDVNRFSRLSGQPISTTAIAKGVDDGLILVAGNRIAATQDGMRLLNALILNLITD